MEYRKEIDGLRALAVLPVIFFHAGFSCFSGGFVGVDVFFVISGYLITSLILIELERGDFSVSRFYERRARRILPALFIVMAVCVPLAWLILPDHELIGFGKSLVGVSTFTSNILFWLEMGYFDVAADFKPLLHTWSLSVEEQYYFLVPLVMLAVWKFWRAHLLPVFVACAVLSLIVAEYGSVKYPSANFFLLYSRIWELALGGLVAIFLHRNSQLPGNSWFAFSGLLLIVGSVVFFDESVPFPGLYALLPTLGTVLLLVFARSGTWVARLLSLPVFVGIGLISYSSYLWHQPIFAFARAFSIGKLTGWELIALSLLSVMLAFLSWKFVERPFREPKRIGRKGIFAFSGVGLTLFVMVGLAFQDTGFIRERVTASGDNFKALSRRLATNVGLGRECFGADNMAVCSSGERPVALLWGDSYAMHLALAVSESKTELPFVQMTKSNCAPILGVAAYDGRGYNVSWGQGCIAHNDKVFTWLEGQSDIKFVIMSSPFRQLSARVPLVVGDGEIMAKNDGYGIAQFKLTIERLRSIGKTPVVVSPPPSPGYNVGKCYVRSRVLGLDPSDCDFSLQDNNKAATYKALKQVGHDSGVFVVWLSDLICPQGGCRSHVENVLMYRDEGHLSREGASYLGRAFDFAGLIVK